MISKKITKKSTKSSVIKTQSKNNNSLNYNFRNFIFTSFAAFICVFIYEYIIHGLVLNSEYQKTNHLWRNSFEMQAYIYYAFLSQFAFAVILTYIYFKIITEKSLGMSIKFGFMAGLFMGIIQAASYSYMPITINLTIAWFFFAIIETIFISLIIYLMQKNKYK
jgi:hypothetical protein